MSRRLARYTPSRRYLWLGVFAITGAILSAWVGLRWTPAWIAAALFVISAVGVLFIALRPAIEIHESHLLIGRRAIAWKDIRRLDGTGWNAPLAVFLTLIGDQRILLFYAGDFESCGSLLRHLRRCSREALLDGVAYREFWGELPQPPERKQLPAPPRYPLLRPEDEEEVERMFQRLKSVGRLDQRSSDDK